MILTHTVSPKILESLPVRRDISRKKKRYVPTVNLLIVLLCLILGYMDPDKEGIILNREDEIHIRGNTTQ